MIPEVSHPTNRCPKPTRWSCYDDMATEVEVIEMLTALVVMLKPEVVVETGCYKGYGTRALVDGVRKNGFGRVFTCDLQSEMIHNTLEMCGCSLLTVEQCLGTELIAKLNTIDFAFLDSSGQAEVRMEEVRLTVPKLSLWGVIAVHDTGQTHPDFREALERTAAELDLDAVYFDTPRGFTILKRKVR